jgi:Bacterial HORMA domain family 1
MSTTLTRSTTFNRSHARYVATKVAADLHRMQRLYGWPTERVIEDLIEEITEMLALDYLKTVEIGFERNGRRVVSVKYESRRDGTLSADDTAGGMPRGVDISACERINYMTYTEKFNTLTPDEQLAVKRTLPYVRTGAPEPTDGDGYWTQDRTYSANGGGTIRRTFRPYS